MKSESEIHELPDGFVLDVTARRLLAGKEDVEIHENAFLLLTHFARHANKVIKNEELKRAVWGNKKVKDDSLVACIKEIRRALDNERSIENQHGRGYIFRNPKAIEFPAPNALSASEIIPQTQLYVRVGTDDGQAETKSENRRSPVFQTSQRVSAEGTTVEDNSTLTRNEFSFLAYTVVGISTLFLLGLARAQQWHASERLAYFETTLILGGIAYNVRRVYLFRKSDLVTDHAHSAVQQFQIFWTLLLLSWLCLYGVWLLKAASYSLPVVATLLNNSNSLMLVLCYFVLNEPTVSKGQNSDRHREEPLFGLKTVFGVIVVVVFAIIEKLALFKFQVDADKTTYILTLSDLVSGIVGGIAMGLFISRLHSRLLGESTLLPIVGLLLYLYAAIQPFYFIVNQPAEIPAGLPAPWPMVLSLRPGIIGLALILKLVMFLYVTAIIRRDRLLFYMINAKRIYSEVEVEWRKSRPR